MAAAWCIEANVSTVDNGRQYIVDIRNCLLFSFENYHIGSQWRSSACTFTLCVLICRFEFFFLFFHTNKNI